MDARTKRAMNVAFINMKARIPADTGSLRNSLRMTFKGANGYKISFDNRYRNTRTHKRVGTYVGFIDPIANPNNPHCNARNRDWWGKAVIGFFNDVSNQLKKPIKNK